MTRPGEWMLREIAEIPQVIARQMAHHGADYAETGARLRRNPPRFFATCARGTSDHAALFFKYLTEIRTGVPVVTLGPSLGSIYDADLQLRDAVLLSVSQSGSSPDLVALQHRAKQGGASTIALLNTTDSPLGGEADIVLPIGAGPEQAVAATKSFVASLTALLAIHAGQTEDNSLLAAVNNLPEALKQTRAVDIDPIVRALLAAETLFILGRGPGLAIAQEAALKLKETCLVHAEAFSAAEFRHGPIALAKPGALVLAFLPEGPARASVEDTLRLAKEYGAQTIPIGSGTPGFACFDGAHEQTLCVLQITLFYRIAAALSLALGLNPDLPPHLVKATLTT